MTHLLELGLLAQLLASLLVQQAVEIKVLGDYRFKSDGFVTKIVFSQDEELIAFGDAKGGIQVLSVPALAVKASLPSRTTEIDSRTRSFSAINSLSFLDQKTLVASISSVSTEPPPVVTIDWPTEKWSVLTVEEGLQNLQLVRNPEQPQLIYGGTLVTAGLKVPDMSNDATILATKGIGEGRKEVLRIPGRYLSGVLVGPKGVLVWEDYERRPPKDNRIDAEPKSDIAIRIGNTSPLRKIADLVTGKTVFGSNWGLSPDGESLAILYADKTPVYDVIESHKPKEKSYLEVWDLKTQVLKSRTTLPARLPTKGVTTVAQMLNREDYFLVSSHRLPGYGQSRPAGGIGIWKLGEKQLDVEHINDEAFDKLVLSPSRRLAVSVSTNVYGMQRIRLWSISYKSVP